MNNSENNNYGEPPKNKGPITKQSQKGVFTLTCNGTVQPAVSTIHILS